jgi:predicted NUDIX family phosphoesterase
MEEEVLVFPAEIMDLYSNFEGFRPYNITCRSLLGDVRSHSKFMPRSEVENDPDFLQPIPYVYIYGWKPGALLYERTKEGGEDRLYNKYSIGVGGHINPCDDKGGNIFTLAAARELEEEFHFVGDRARGLLPTDFTIRGFIRRTDTPVNSVHFGIVYAFATPTEQIDVASSSIRKIGWCSLEQLKSPETYDRLEDWSRDVVDFLYR